MVLIGHDIGKASFSQIVCDFFKLLNSLHNWGIASSYFLAMTCEKNVSLIQLAKGQKKCYCEGCEAVPLLIHLEVVRELLSHASSQ